MTNTDKMELITSLENIRNDCEYLGDYKQANKIDSKIKVIRKSMDVKNVSRETTVIQKIGGLKWT
jgi:hypothetical protein